MFPTFKEVCDMLKQKTDLVEPIAASRSAGSHNKAQPTDFELCIDEVQSIAKLVKSGRLRNNLTQTALAMLDNALNARELIKITVNQSVHDDIVKFMLDLSAKLHAEIIEKKGFTIVLYRKNPKKDILKL